ncbi:MAG: ABC transporter ATP-binding protein [Armatimonadetes bacterium]|nr:ABC transporter ATP-binding protein [Anaerolineae bacterium]
MTLRLDALVHTYTAPSGEQHTVLHIPAWEAYAGAQILLRGVSGSGKTTLFNIIAGLMRPTSGTVWHGDQALYALPEARRDQFRARNIGYVFQTHHLIPSLTALENVIMPLAFARVLPQRSWQRRATELLTQVGLAGHIQYRPHQLSTGQRLRIAVARALANTPRVLLADEPTAALDTESGALVMDLLQRICHESNAVLLVASHDPALMTRFETVVDLQGGLLSATLSHAEIG